MCNCICMYMCASIHSCAHSQGDMAEGWHIARMTDPEAMPTECRKQCRHKAHISPKRSSAPSLEAPLAHQLQSTKSAKHLTMSPGHSRCWAMPNSGKRNRYKQSEAMKANIYNMVRTCLCRCRCRHLCPCISTVNVSSCEYVELCV